MGSTKKADKTIGDSSTSMILIGLNQSMQQSIQMLSGSQGVHFEMVKELFYDGPIALFFNKLSPSNNELISIMRYYNLVLKELNHLETIIDNIDFDKIQMQSNSENRSNKIVEIAGEVDKINQLIIEQSSKLNEAFQEFHDLVVNNIKLNKEFLDSYTTALNTCYEEITKILKLDFKTHNTDVFDIIRIPEIESFAQQHNINLAEVESNIENLDMIMKFACLQLYTQIEYNKQLAKSVVYDSSEEKKSFTQKLQSMLTTSPIKVIMQQTQIYIKELKSSNQNFLMVAKPKNQTLLNELISSDRTLKKLKLQLKKYPQKIREKQDQTYDIPSPKKNIFNWKQVGKLPDNLQ